MERFTISKSEKQTIYEIYRACRLCGAGGGYRMPIIQNIIDLDNSEVGLRQKIQECLQLEVRPDDRMPPLICELCVDKVNDFYQFLELTRLTNVRTRTRLGLPLPTAKKGEPEQTDCILGVTEPVYVKDNEPPSKKGKAGPKSSKKITKEPEPVQVKVEITSSASSRSSSLSSRSSRAGAAPTPASAPEPSPRTRRRQPEPQKPPETKSHTPKPAEPTPAVREKKPRVKELETLLQTMAELKTMGDLAATPPEGNEEVFHALVASIDEHFPREWRNWRIFDYAFDEFFGGDQLPTAVEVKLRFAIPTSDLARAFNPNASSLSERSYTAIRQTLVQWPLGRALIYSPHNLMEKVHAPCYDPFMNTVREIKSKLVNRTEAASELRQSRPKINSKTMGELKTMGDLVESPPEGNEEVYHALVASIDEHFPREWRNWKIYDYAFDKLFGGDQIPRAVEAKLRFAIPTSDLARAFNPNASFLSERTYTAIRQTLVHWPLGRALLYAPHSLMVKVHSPCYDPFINTVQEIKCKLVNRTEASSELEQSSPRISSKPTGVGKKRIHVPSLHRKIGSKYRSCRPRQNHPILGFQTMAELKTMGDLVESPPEGNEEVFHALVAAIDEHFPREWRNWRIHDFSFHELFGGDQLPGAVESKLRFAIPTSDLARAFNPNASFLSKRTYRAIRQTLVQWPLGRALLYAPHSLMEKVHAPCYDPFMNTVQEIKSKVVKRTEASSELGQSSPRISSKPTGVGKKRIHVLSSHRKIGSRYWSSRLRLNHPILDFQTTAELKTMGDLAESPPEGNEEVFHALVSSIDEHFPREWRSWRIYDYAFHELFGGDQLSREMEAKLRFAIPTSDLARAFNPNASSLSERTYTAIRQTLVQWPLGRALLYAPHSLMVKVHAPCYDPLMNTVREIKSKLVKRTEASSELGQSNPRISSKSTGVGKKRIHALSSHRKIGSKYRSCRLRLKHPILGFQAMAELKTMGDLAESPPEGNEEVFHALVASIDEQFPREWRNWKIHDYAFHELFGGDQLPGAVESKLRFAIPTSDLARAFNPNASFLSKRTYRAIRQTLVQWPLGRALLYAPHSLMVKVHSPCYDPFMNTVREIKSKLVKRSKASSELRQSRPRVISKSNSIGEKRICEPSPGTSSTKRSRTLTPPRRAPTEVGHAVPGPVPSFSSGPDQNLDPRFFTVHVRSDSMKYDDNALLIPRAMKRTREDPPRPALLPKRAKPAPPKEPVKEPTPPPRSKPGPKSKKARPEPKAPEPKAPEPPKAPEKKPSVPFKVIKSKAKPETPAKQVKETPKPPEDPSTPKGPPFKCAVCDAQLKNMGGYTTHMRSHAPTYTKITHACNPCGKWFTTSEEATTHHRYHSAVTFPYHCRRCFEDYSSLQLYNEHIEKGLCTQWDEKPDFACEDCGGSFATEPLRSAHKCSGDMSTTKCPHCSKTYSTATNMRRHKKQCTQRRKRDLIADPDVLRRLKPMQVRIIRCDGLFSRAVGDHYDVSTVKPNYGLAKNYVYPYLKINPVKTEPLNNMSHPVVVKKEVETDRYSHWDSDDSDCETVIRRVPTLTTLSIKRLFSKNLLGKIPRKRKRVRDETFGNENDFDNISNDINDIISSLGDDLGNGSLDRKDLTAKIKDIIGCLDDSEMGDENLDRNENDETLTVNESSKGENETGLDRNENDETLTVNESSKDENETGHSGDLENDESTKDNLIQSNKDIDDREETSNVELSNGVEISDSVSQNNNTNHIDEEHEKLNRLDTETENHANINNDNTEIDNGTENHSDINNDNETDIHISLRKSVENEIEMADENREPENVSVNGSTNYEKENLLEDDSKSNNCNIEKTIEETSNQLSKESPIKHSIENLIGETDKNPDKYISEVISSIEDIIQKNNPINDEIQIVSEVNGQTVNDVNDSNLLNVLDENSEAKEKRLSDNDKITLDDLLPKEDLSTGLENISDDDFNFDA